MNQLFMRHVLVFGDLSLCKRHVLMSYSSKLLRSVLIQTTYMCKLNACIYKQKALAWGINRLLKKKKKKAKTFLFSCCCMLRSLISPILPGFPTCFHDLGHCKALKTVQFLHCFRTKLHPAVTLLLTPHKSTKGFAWQKLRSSCLLQ